MEEEIWKDIKGYEGHYQVSNLGNVRGLDRVVKNSNGTPKRLKIKIIKFSKNSNGYLNFNLCKNGKTKTFTAHRLVAINFIGIRPGTYVVNHKDGDKFNNDVRNLEWVTRKQNTCHAYKTGLMNAKRDGNGVTKFKKEDISIIKGMINDGLSNRKIAKMFHVSHITISNLRNNKTWKNYNKK